MKLTPRESRFHLVSTVPNTGTAGWLHAPPHFPRRIPAERTELAKPTHRTTLGGVTTGCEPEPAQHAWERNTPMKKLLANQPVRLPRRHGIRHRPQCRDRRQTSARFSATVVLRGLLHLRYWKIADSTVPFGVPGVLRRDLRHGGGRIPMPTGTRTRCRPMDLRCRTVITRHDRRRQPVGIPLVLACSARYPFALGPVSIFPLAGIEYDLNLYWKDVDGNDLKASLTTRRRPTSTSSGSSSGSGSDIGLYKGLYVRPLVLFGLQTPECARESTISRTRSTPARHVARKTDFLFEGGVQVGWRF